MDKFHEWIIEKRIKESNIDWIIKKIVYGIVVIILFSILGKIMPKM